MKQKALTVDKFVAGTGERITDSMLPSWQERFLANQDRSFATIGYYREERVEQIKQDKMV